LEQESGLSGLTGVDRDCLVRSRLKGGKQKN